MRSSCNNSKNIYKFVLVNNFKEMYNSSKSISLSKANESSKLRLTTMDVNRFKIDFESDSESGS